MNETLQRSLAGLVYMFLIIVGATLKDATTIVFLFFGLVCLNEVNKLIKEKNFWSYVFLVFALLGVHLNYIQQNGVLFFLPLFALTNILLARDLFTKTPKYLALNNKYLLSFGYVVPSFVLLVLAGNVFGEHQPEILVGFFFLIWFNDSFAYVFGKSIGKHKLFERISPKKTIEGFLGGLLMSIILSQIINYIYPSNLTQLQWLGMAIIVGIGGTIGDLIQSKIKRIANVKDSGKIMPGHGGIFDRMDSTVFSITFVYIFLILSTYVS